LKGESWINEYSVGVEELRSLDNSHCGVMNYELSAGPRSRRASEQSEPRYEAQRNIAVNDECRVEHK
jgi:hypothetical protein